MSKRAKLTRSAVRDSRATGDEEDFVELLRVDAGAVRALDGDPERHHARVARLELSLQDPCHPIARLEDEHHLVNFAARVDLAAPGYVGDAERVLLAEHVRRANEGRVSEGKVGVLSGLPGALEGHPEDDRAFDEDCARLNERRTEPERGRDEEL